MNCDHLLIERLRITRGIEYQCILLSRTREEWAIYNALGTEEKKLYDQHVNLWRYAEIHGLCPPIPGTEPSECPSSDADYQDHRHEQRSHTRT